MEIGDKIMHTFLTNRYVYKTNQTEVEINSTFDEITKSYGLFEDYRVNLCGEVSKGKFKLYRKSGIILIQSWDKNPVTIYGEIKKNEQNLIDLDVEFKPNFVFLFFVIASIIVTLFVINAEIPKEKVSFLNILIAPFFTVLMWTIAYHTVAYHKGVFERGFGLEKADDPVSSRFRL